MGSEGEPTHYHWDALGLEALAASCSPQNSPLQSFISTFRLQEQQTHASTVKPMNQDHGKNSMRSMVGLGANKSGNHTFIYIHPKQAQWTKCKKFWAKQWPVQFGTAAKPGTCCLSIWRLPSMLETWTHNNSQTKLWCGSMFHCLAEMKSPNSGMWWLPKVTQPGSITGRPGRLPVFTNFQSWG